MLLWFCALFLRSNSKYYKYTVGLFSNWSLLLCDICVVKKSEFLFPESLVKLHKSDEASLSRSFKVQPTAEETQPFYVVIFTSRYFMPSCEQGTMPKILVSWSALTLKASKYSRQPRKHFVRKNFAHLTFTHFWETNYQANKSLRTSCKLNTINFQLSQKSSTVHFKRRNFLAISDFTSIWNILVFSSIFPFL